MEPDTNPPSQNVESENTLMRVLTGILEDSVQTLQRIEKSVAESTKIANELIQKIDSIDKKIESGFVAVVKKALPSLEQKFSEKIDNIGNFGDITALLPDIINKLQQSMQILTIQSLISELDKVPREKKKEVEKKEAVESEKPTRDEKKSAIKAPTPSTPQEEVASAQPSSKEKDKDKDKDKEKQDEDHLLRPSSFFNR